MSIENKTNGPIVNRNIVSLDISARESEWNSDDHSSNRSVLLTVTGETAHILASLETTNCDQLLAKLDRKMPG